MKKRYAIVIEQGKRNCGAYVPDVDGCVALAKTVTETKAMIQEALEFHFESMAEDGETIPEPTAVVDYIEVDVPTKTKAPAATRSRTRKKMAARQ